MKIYVTLLALAAVFLSTEAVIRGERWHEAPWMVRIMYGQALANLGAGGAIISNRHILTTAFIMGQNFQQIQIFSSSSFRGLQTPLAVQGRVPHPAYQPNPRLNDIGIFRVVNDIVFSALMQPIRLPSRALPYESEQGIALGFGGSPVAAPNNADLFAAFMRVVPTARCNQRFQFHTPPTQFCAEDARIRSDVCEHDRGGPFVTLDRGVEVLTGIASDFFCTTLLTSDTSLFTRVSGYRAWIDSTMALP